MLSNGDIIKMTVNITFPTGDGFLNVYYANVDSIGTATDTQVLDEIKQYLLPLYSAFGSSWNSAVDVIDVVVTRWDLLLQQFVPVGSRLLSISGGQGSGALPGATTGSATARTLRPRTRGRKSYSGFDENSANRGILGGVALTDLAMATAFWLVQITIPAVGFVMSPGVQRVASKLFQEFSGSAIVKNIMGTMVTRKALRGQ